MGTIQNGKKINIKLIVVLSIIILLIVFFCLYKFNYGFRQTVNGLITLQTNTNENVPMINIDQNTTNAILGYDEYFAILKQNNITGYINEKAEFQNSVPITNPIYAVEGKYLLIAEKGDNKVFLFNGKNLVYENKVGGEITGLTVNKNGYVAVVVNKSGYRSIVTVYNPDGIEMFSTFFSTTYASHVKISPNNKNMVIVEVDTSGIQVNSNIKFVQIDKITENTQTINASKESSRVISDIQFATNDTVVYVTDTMVREVNLLGQKNDILDLQNANIVNVDIGLGKYIVRTEKTKSGIFNTSTYIVIVDRENQEVGRYTLDGTIKQVKVNHDVIAANIGQELYFLSSTGRPIKKYISNSDVKDIVIYNSGKMAALVYRNKVEIIYI